MGSRILVANLVDVLFLVAFLLLVVILLHFVDFEFCWFPPLIVGFLDLGLQNH